MKAVNVDDVLKILSEYGSFVFTTDSKRYTEMVCKIANLPELKQESTTDVLDKSRDNRYRSI